MYENLLANVPTDLWIGGKWRKASDGGRFDVLDPATENKVASVASATVEDAKAAVDAASEAFAGWAARKPRDRGARIAAVHGARASAGRALPACRIVIPAWPALLDMDIASFDPPEILQALAERRHAELAFGIFLCQPRNQHADPPHPLGVMHARKFRA
jgi:hypothetical protein